MENRYNIDNFERYIKEQADDFRMIPSKRVWHGLYNGMHPGRRWPSFFMFFFLITGVLYIGKEGTSISNNTSEEQEQNIAKSSTKNNRKLVSIYKNKEVYAEVFSTNHLLENDWIINEPETGYLQEDIISKEDVFVSAPSNSKSIAAGSLTSSEENASTKLPFISDDNSIESSSLENNISVDEEKLKAEKKSTKEKATQPILTANDNKKQEAALAKLKTKNNKKDNTTIEFYATPSIGFRNLNTEDAFYSNGFAANSPSNNSNQSFFKHKPSLNLEAGFNVAFAASKKISLKAGVQLNLTNYNISGKYLNHSTPTSIAEINSETGAIDYNLTSAYIGNDVNGEKIRNTTYQISLPVGAYYKVLAKSKFDLFVGASVQPTFVFGGNPNLLSADKQYYINNPTLLRKWNMNTAAEAYINYKFGNVNLLAGPQFRYQILSTYKSNIAISERLYNIGFKIGLAKNF